MQKKPFLTTAINLILVAIQATCVAITAVAQSKGFVLTPVVKRGDAVGDGGRFFDCGECEGRVIGFHALNNQADVAIGADVVGGTCFTGRFLISAGQVIRLADFCQESEFGRFNLLGPVNLNDVGQAAINTGVIVNDQFKDMLLLYSQGRLTKVVEEGERSPIGTIFKGCGFGQPAINNRGEVAFFACGETDEGFFFGDGVFIYSNGQKRKVVVNSDPSPIGGQFALNFVPPQSVQLNDNGDVLFEAGVILDPFIDEKFGLFLATKDGIKAIEVDGDSMPSGGIVTPRTFGFGDLNNKGGVVFAVGLTGSDHDSGIFLYSEDEIVKIMAEGEATPIGGRFSTLVDSSFLLPRINDNGIVAFKNKVTGGSAASAIFLASPRAMVKVVAVGDKLPSGGRVRDITSFALNDFSQVAFYAEVNNGPKGVFLATPLSPRIKKVKLKRRQGSLELMVKGSGFITNDSVIEVNGVALTQMSYPEQFRQSGGTATRVVSRDSRLEELMGGGQEVEVRVFNSLTNLRSAAVIFSRSNR